MRWGLLLWLLTSAACHRPTSLRIDVALADAVPAPSALRVTVFGHGVVGSSQSLAVADRSFPASLLVTSLTASLPDPRVLLEGMDGDGLVRSEASGRVQLRDGEQTRVSLTLASPESDQDLDGVPDAIDDCPTVPDRDQLCASVDAAIDEDLSAAADAGDDGPPPDLGADLSFCPAGALFCEDFEIGDLGRWTSTQQSPPAATVGVDGTRPYHGAFALDGRVGLNPPDLGGTSVGAYAVYAFNSGAPTTVSAKAHLYVTTTPGPYAIFLNFQRSDGSYGVGADPSNNWIVTNPFLGDHASTVAVETGKWLCVVLQMDFSGLGRIRLFVDGTTVVDFVPPSNIVPTELWAGLPRGPGSQLTQVFTDDIVLAAGVLACP